METGSRKRAEASPAAHPPSPPSTRSSTRRRLSPTRPRPAAQPMETESSSSRGRRRGRGAPARPQGSRSRDKLGGGSNEKGSGSSGGKGKEKEAEAKGRERDSGFGFDGDSRGGGDHDEDSDGGGGDRVHLNLGSTGSVLEGLLRRIGVGLDDLIPSSGLVPASSSQQDVRFNNILAGLRSDGEEERQVAALTQLCEMLSMGTEDSLSTFSVDSYVPVLVGLLNHEGNADIMLLSARAITHLCDVLPSSCAAVVQYGAVPCFCARLLTIEYMDLAEQSLQALKKISQEHPTACLRSGALMALLSYLDFFSTGVQRVALTTAANMCKKLTSDSADFVIDAVPLLTNLLQYHDAKVLEYASICLTHIAEAFASSPEKLDTLCNHGLVAQAASLISIGNSRVAQAPLSTSTYTGLIRLLSICVSGSAIGAKTLFLLGISGILKEILSGSGEVSSIFVLPVLYRPPEQILELVKLADELLPPLPQGAILLPSFSHSLVKGSSAMKKSLATVSVKKEDSAGGVAELSPREQLLRDQPELLQQFGVDLLPVIVQVYESSVSGPVCHKCLSVIGKLMFFSTADMIESLLGSTNVASFLEGVLARKDSQTLIPSLWIAKILMEKLPGTFSKKFVREGVMHAVDMLISADSSLASRADSAEKGKDIPPEISQTRRGRRCTGSHNVGVGSPEDSKMLVVGSTSSPASLEASSVNSIHRTKVITHAKAFKDKYFPDDTGASELFASDDLLHLKNLCGKLNVVMDNSNAVGKGKSKASASHSPEISSPNEKHLVGIISELLLQLGKDGGVSTFEFISSGIVLALLNYFSCGTFSKDKVPEAEMTKFRKQAIKRFKSFVSVALPTGMHKANNRAPLTVLIQKLESALSSLERFQVILSHPSRSLNGTTRLSTGLSALVQPLNLRLCRAHGEKTLRDFSSNIVRIDPLTSLTAVEDFLWPRVHRRESVQNPLPTSSTSGAARAPSGAAASHPGAHAPSGRRSSTRFRSSMSAGVHSISGEGSKKDSYEGLSNLSKGRGKAVVKSSSDNVKGPQTRNSACRKAISVSDMGAHMKSVHTSLEVLDLDVSHTDVDYELVIEDDDISEDGNDHEMLADDSHPVMLERVHDVKLNDAAEDSVTPYASGENQTSVTEINERSKTGRGADQIEFRGRAPFASRGGMSFATATRAGLTSGGGSRSIRSSRDRRRLLMGSSNDSPKLVFSAGGKQISRNFTIYQAVQQQLVFDEDDDERYTSSDLLSGEGSRLLSDIYTITYRKADNQVDLGSYDGSASSSVQNSGRSLSTSSSSNDSVWKQTSLLDSILFGNLPCDMEKSNRTYNVLALLRVLNGLNQLAPRFRVLAASDDFVEGKVSNFDELITSDAVVPSEEFINGKLTSKLARQVQDAFALCSGCLPSWCYQLTKACPFLFSFETRRQFFYSTAFGLSRALHRLQQQGSENQGFAGEGEARFRRLKRQKVRVSRNRILDSAAKVMEMYSSQKAVLEVEYFGEVGTGLGPTLEFYTLLSHDLQKVNLGMWRSSGTLDNYLMETDLDEQKERNVVSHTRRVKLLENSVTSGADYVDARLGLFPRPWPPSVDFSEGSQYYKVVDYFRLFGRVMAKALQDGRLMDLPLSPAFYKLVLGQELDLHDICLFDAELGKTLRELQLLVWRKQYLEFVGTTNLIADLCFRGAPIEDLCLDFTLPGYPDYVLKLGEENTMVDINNLEEYVSLVVDATMKAGIMRQVEAFRTGFSQVFDITSLQIFSPHELDYLLCGHRELWKAETLVDHIKFNHGYTAKSPAIINLLEIMGEFTPEQQRAFCQFVTGAPQLPPGGLAVLNPKLTIVRKQTSSVAGMASNSGDLSESGDDNLLPSVMTCANYLKLPSYSTKEIMYKKLLYAISEGQGSFDLS